MKDINNLIKDQSIVYVTNDPERSLGLEKIIDDFYTVCVDDSYILNFLKNYYSLKKDIPQKDIYRNSNLLLKEISVQKYISKIKNPNFMFFKIAPNIEYTLKGKNILNTKSNLNKKYENKIIISKIFKDLVPKTIDISLRENSYEYIKNRVGSNFVIQFQRGQSGNSTFFINNSREFNQIKTKYPFRIAKAVQRIDGEYYTLNGVITKDYTLLGNLTRQITGIPILTNYKGGSVGNDWNTKLSSKNKETFFNTMNLISEYMRKDGYKGMFGADFVFDGKKVYLIEINARENATIPIFSKIQIEKNIMPFKLIHVLEFLKIKYNINPKKINEDFYEDVNLNQIIIRNIKKDLIEAKMKFNGLYNEHIEKISEGYDIDSLDNNNYLILTNKNFITPNMEISRVVSKKNIKVEMIEDLLKDIY